MRCNLLAHEPVELPWHRFARLLHEVVVLIVVPLTSFVQLDTIEQKVVGEPLDSCALPD
jgi:hypothetical protein